ncbi:hypothetical protein FCM35_KLT02430 [Carex littledalei]|uniref:Uncharacterized protein n=1 Tax=Carex littledalei TaxID=544730 RepID=A0A833R3Q3_9POAL|nr:hypothetical protein FCM35_KLT02430 [Carex littledalei]
MAALTSSQLDQISNNNPNRLSLTISSEIPGLWRRLSSTLIPLSHSLSSLTILSEIERRKTISSPVKREDAAAATTFLPSVAASDHNLNRDKDPY